MLVPAQSEVSRCTRRERMNKDTLIIWSPLTTRMDHTVSLFLIPQIPKAEVVHFSLVFHLPTRSHHHAPTTLSFSHVSYLHKYTHFSHFSWVLEDRRVSLLYMSKGD